MTATVTELDQPAPPAAPPLQVTRWWLVALSAFLAGVLAVIAVLATRPDRKLAPATPTTDIVRFVPEGGRVDYAAVWDATGGPGQVSYASPVKVTAPWTVVLTVRAEVGATAICRIYVGEQLIDEERAANGSSATCVSVRR